MSGDRHKGQNSGGDKGSKAYVTYNKKAGSKQVSRSIYSVRPSEHPKKLKRIRKQKKRNQHD